MTILVLRQTAVGSPVGEMSVELSLPESCLQSASIQGIAEALHGAVDELLTDLAGLREGQRLVERVAANQRQYR